MNVGEDEQIKANDKRMNEQVDKQKMRQQDETLLTVLMGHYWNVETLMV